MATSTWTLPDLHFLVVRTSRPASSPPPPPLVSISDSSSSGLPASACSSGRLDSSVSCGASGLPAPDGLSPADLAVYWPLASRLDNTVTCPRSIIIDFGTTGEQEGSLPVDLGPF